MNQRRFHSKVRVFFVHVFMLLSLVASGCGGTATATESPPTGAPATEVPTEAPTEAPVTEVPATEVPTSNIPTCSEPYPALDHLKPPLSLDQLPQPDEQRLLDPDRVIGFNFPDGQSALIASPAQAECFFDEASGWGQALGVVWRFEPGSNELTGYILAVDPTQTETFLGKLVSLDFTEAEDITIIHSALTRQTGQATELIDASLCAGGVCFRVGQDNFCSQDDKLDVRAFQAANYDTIVNTLMSARDVLITEGILSESDTILEEQAISEIEDPSHIQECSPGVAESCQADIILAPLAAEEYLSGAPWGIIVVVQELTSPDTDLVIPPGDYAVVVEVDGQVALAKFEGVTEAGDSFNEEVQAVLTPDMDSTGNGGQAAILTCRLGRICLLWECQ